MDPLNDPYIGAITAVTYMIPMGSIPPYVIGENGHGVHYRYPLRYGPLHPLIRGSKWGDLGGPKALPNAELAAPGPPRPPKWTP